ncbi:Pr6Pr family membrane protein [Microbacterium sp. No. 7]|uniref:Pr6Pr family membrane protein n=1 Tax=Microbacterium sp. No. 7 TaxID=1714373 RepID=UPI0006D18172|nr:Pr6Pr family membrane protein [Microbacterium sp. No. 7]ALJ22115.1 hypothetical protein AOA12_20410 [Microbacterium sp. No. 7]
MDSSPRSRTGIAILRLTWGCATLVAIVATLVDTASRGPVNPLNFFGYFTVQSNTLTCVVAVIAGLAGLAASGVQPRWIVMLRALATTCMVIVGLVYALLLAPLGAAGGVPLPWANAVMHVAGPLLVLADWVLVRDRSALPWRAALLQLAYPAVWIVVVLVRGMTDGWVPYPFLDPARGYAAVSAAVVGIAVAFLAVSSAVVWWSRVYGPRGVTRA